MGSPHPGKHTVGVPLVTGVALLPAGERVGLTAVVILVGTVRREQHTEPPFLFGMPVFRNGHIPAALVYEVALAVVAVMVLAVPQQTSATVILASLASVLPVQVAHLVGGAENTLIHGVVTPDEVTHRVVVEDDRFR